MPTRLKKLRVKRIDLVDQGACFDPDTGEGAHVLLYKRAEGKPMDEEQTEKSQPTSEQVDVPGFARCKKCDAQVEKGCTKCQKCGASMEEDDVEKVAADKSAEEVQVDEKLKADLDAANAEIARLKQEAETLAKRLDTPEQIEKRKVEAEEIQKKLADANDRIAKMEAREAENAQIESVKKSMPHVPGKAEDVGRLLKRIKDVASEEDFVALTTILKAASEQIQKGDLFKEKGRDGDGAEPETPFAKAMRLAGELVAKSKDMKQEDALAVVFREHPELYAEYVGRGPQFAPTLKKED